MTWQQHERLHDALDHQAYHDELADREFHRSYDFAGGYYGNPTYPAYSAYGNYAYRPYGGSIDRPYGGYYNRPFGGYYNQPYGVSNYRPFSSRFGLYSPRWGVMYNSGYYGY
jgi:hypothetical protein